MSHQMMLRIAFSILGGAAWLLIINAAIAQSPQSTSLELQLPSDGAVGQEMTVAAQLTDQTGAAVIGAEVIFLRDTRFMNSSSELSMGRATTNSQGVASLLFVPRSEGDQLIFSEFEGDDRHGSSFSEGSAFIQTGPGLYEEEAGVKVPGINVSLLVAILGGVWGTYFVVMALVWLIALEGSTPPPESEAFHE
ncbi:MAG: hypothetical protein QF368_10935 [SAR202 cluster bacterium]|jgi:hypothetical protein|nr:hypothetical protein [SAR202 cluster bacterium]